jgi:hypothetical protein
LKNSIYIIHQIDSAQEGRLQVKKQLKVGVLQDAGDPPFRWNILVLDLAMNDASSFLDGAQYHHVAEQVQELARERDPTHSATQRVASIEDFFELKDKGGPLGRINARVFFVLDKPRAAIVVLGAIFKQNEGKTPEGDRVRMGRRKRKYLAGDYGDPDALIQVRTRVEGLKQRKKE